MTLLEIYRRAIQALWLAAGSDIRRIPATPEALGAALPVIVETYGHAVAVAAAEFYDSMRLGAGIDDGFEAVLPSLDDRGTDELVGWAAATAVTAESFPALVAAGAQRRIANFARETITESSYIDPNALGWMRIGTPQCTFCAMLIARGAVYSTRTATFASHDHCDCQAVPAFDRSHIRDVNREFVSSARRRSRDS